jgi:hypothetical protein
MPAGLEKLKTEIWNKLKGKINPRTDKPYIESDAWAIATAQWKKMGNELSEGSALDIANENIVFERSGEGDPTEIFMEAVKDATSKK